MSGDPQLNDEEGSAGALDREGGDKPTSGPGAGQQPGKSSEATGGLLSLLDMALVDVAGQVSEELFEEFEYCTPDQDDEAALSDLEPGDEGEAGEVGQPDEDADQALPGAVGTASAQSELGESEEAAPPQSGGLKRSPSPREPGDEAEAGEQTGRARQSAASQSQAGEPAAPPVAKGNAGEVEPEAQDDRLSSAVIDGLPALQLGQADKEVPELDAGACEARGMGAVAEPVASKFQRDAPEATGPVYPDESAEDWGEVDELWSLDADDGGPPGEAPAEAHQADGTRQEGAGAFPFFARAQEAGGPCDQAPLQQEPGSRSQALSPGDPLSFFADLAHIYDAQENAFSRAAGTVSGQSRDATGVNSRSDECAEFSPVPDTSPRRLHDQETRAGDRVAVDDLEPPTSAFDTAGLEVEEREDRCKAYKDSSGRIAFLELPGGTWVRLTESKPTAISTRADGKWTYDRGKWWHEHNGPKAIWKGKIEVDKDGNICVQRPGSLERTIYETNGSRTLFTRDFSTITENLDGSKVHKNFKGEITLIENPDGTKVRYEDGKPVSQ